MPHGDAMDVDRPVAASQSPSQSQARSQDAPLDPAARERELDEQFPNRPRNHSVTLPFHTLFQDLFQPLMEENAKTKSSTINRRGLGPDYNRFNKQENKRAIIDRYFSRWRRDVGDDFFPAFRLIVPDKDRDRAMYGLKEKALGRYLIKIMNIDRHSADAAKILNWKTPLQGSSSGDFPVRCFEVISQRPSRDEVGDMTIQEVNDELDALSAASKEDMQLPILSRLYQRMNAEELKWLIRIILRDMKIGSTEKTFFYVWHPDADSLFNISSSLRRVCWDLHDPHVRLEGEERGVALMSCFQPQLASWQVKDFDKMTQRMMPTEDDQEFFIEEKLDGERMQLHMVKDDSLQGGKNFKFWSRKAKDYTYLYGKSLDDEKGSLTKHLANAFADDVDNIILDGEMITWDPEQDRQGVFGTLKTAALSEQTNPFAGKIRPLLRVFDILLVNNRPVTQYTLRKRREILQRSVRPVHRRFEILDYKVGTSVDEIETHLRKVVEDAAEGLVIKNPRSAYRTGDRNTDWIKVKPEYMQDFGETLECLVVAGFYGSGKRGGGISSFMCGLRADEPKSGKPQKFLTFFKVGGGIKAEDYDTFKHMTEGKWHDFDPKNPPTEYLQLAGAPKERPDVWIKPEDSFVIQAKAAEITQTDEFAAGLTLRFPRFVKLRQDKDWKSVLSVQEFLDLKAKKDEKQKEKKFEADEERRKKRKLTNQKKPLKMVGYGAPGSNKIKIDEATQSGSVFRNLTFFVMTDATRPVKKTKPQLEEMIKAKGGSIVQTHLLKDTSQILCIAERRTVKVASLEKKGGVTLIKPIWLFDCIEQADMDTANSVIETILPWEVDRHIFHMPDDEKPAYEGNVDKYGDAYYRDTSVDELRELMGKMESGPVLPKNAEAALTDNMRDNDMPGWMFKGMRMFFDVPTVDCGSKVHREMEVNRRTVEFGGAGVATEVGDETVTHIIVSPSSDLKALRKTISSRRRIPRLVPTRWISESWQEKTLIDEERYVP